MCGLMSDLVICKFRKSMVIHDTECPYHVLPFYDSNPDLLGTSIALVFHV